MIPALTKRRAAEAVVDGEFLFTKDDFACIAEMLYDTAGITLSESKAALVYSRLAKRIRALGLANFAEYCDLVGGADGDDERATMLNALTTNVTRFFREPHHFDHLAARVLAPAEAAVRAGGRLRLWSAGCSSGQEPYSMALTILENMPEAASLDIKILATDIDSRVIAHGQAGVYSEDLIEPISQSLRGRFLERDPSDRRQWRVNAAVRSMVAFKPLNLIGPSWPMKGPFQAIFCRNVVIYFDEPTQERVWSRMHPLIAPEGRLYIGHSERLGAAGDKFVSDGLTVYRKSGSRSQ
jgi:chemotaxis protein methyltransferase CheR